LKVRRGARRGRRLRAPLRLAALRSGIRYTRVFEDGETDRCALAVAPGARVLVIASAGDRALDAVAWGAGHVIAVDPVPAQLRLTALKVAAAGVLDSADLIALFSLGRHADARRLYAGLLRPRLAAVDQRYWDRWIGLFAIGLHEHHLLGRAVAMGGVLLRVIGGRTLRRMIDETLDSAAQARLYESRLRRRYWNPVTRWVLGRNTVVRLFTANRAERRGMLSGRFHEWLEPNMSRVVATSLVRENAYWMPIIGGRPVEPDHETAWLRPASIETLRTAPARVRLARGSVVDVVNALPAGSLDAAALSNVPDWLTASELEWLWVGLAHALAPGGRAVMRSTLQPPPRPPRAAVPALVIDEAASTELTLGERTGIFAAVTLLIRHPPGRGRERM
jgi:S-adenosylmethionine-diacylglycerol 3-amino-3-carboxypropyl transferase